MFFSKSTGGFYVEDIHGENMPPDVVQITKELHAKLLNGNASGKLIVGDENGYPILIDAPEPSYKEKRMASYPTIVDQLDTIFHDGIDAWKAQIQAVKDQFPKPGA